MGDIVPANNLEHGILARYYRTLPLIHQGLRLATGQNSLVGQARVVRDGAVVVRDNVRAVRDFVVENQPRGRLRGAEPEVLAPASGSYIMAPRINRRRSRKRATTKKTSLKKYVKDCCDSNFETRRIQTVLSGDMAAFSTSPSFLTNVPQGQQFNQRSGRRIKLKSYEIRGHLYNNAVCTRSVNLRLIIFYDKREGALVTPGSELFQGPSASTSGFLDMHTWPGRFKIVRDMQIPLGIQNVPNPGPKLIGEVGRDVHIKGRLSDEVVFKVATATGGVGDVARNRLQVLMCVSHATEKTLWSFSGLCEVRYADLG